MKIEYDDEELDKNQINLEILERLKILHEEIENLKKMQHISTTNATKNLPALPVSSGKSKVFEWGADEEISAGKGIKDDEELMADIRRAQAETSKRKWIPQTNSNSTGSGDNFWGWVIGISIIVIFLAFGATFLAIRTYW